MLFDKRKLYPLWGLTIVFVVLFFVGLNWWKVEHVSRELCITGRAIYIAALVGTVTCIVVSIVLKNLFDSVSEEQYKIKSMVSALEKKIDEGK